MSDTFESLVRDWEGHAVVTRYDRPTSTWIFICIHDPTLGPASGGTRMKVYPTPVDGLRDAMRLAEGMTDKWAVLGLPFGGGKAVLAGERPISGAARTGLLSRYGALIESLGGIFQTGEDMGTSPADLGVVASATRFVHGFDRQGAKIDPGPFTAHGVLAGLKAALERAFGTPEPRGRTILIEGVGNVGSRLAQELAEEGAHLVLCDLDTDRTNRLARELGAASVEPHEVFDTNCDVYAPCAVGATLNADSIPRLGCRVVAGSANNQLGAPADAERLRQRGIVYAPDFIINAGGAYAFALIHEGLDERQTLMRRVESLGDTVGQVLREAEERSESSLAAAKRRVADVLAQGRQPATTPAAGEA